MGHGREVTEGKGRYVFLFTEIRETHALPL